MCVGAECREVAMWVWSDELVERMSGDGADARERVPLVAYAVGSEADLDELASEVLYGVRSDDAESNLTAPRVVDR
jgi:hypothetical protein